MGTEARKDTAGARAVLWCRTCEQPARLVGSRARCEFRRAVHVATGLEAGGDGHPLDLTDENPELRAEADQIEAEHGGRFRVVVRFGIPRAYWRKRHLPPGADPGPLDAPDLPGLRRRLAEVTRAAERDAARSTGALL